jgi:hypothetical protein
MDHFGSAVRHTGPRGAGPAARNLRRNRFDRGRSSYRSRPACGSPRRRTAAPTPPRHGTPTRLVDERHDCQDIGSAYVPGTVWGTASSLTAKFRPRRRACLSREPSLTHQRPRVSLRPMPPDARAPSRHTPITEPSILEISNRAALGAVKYRAPFRRGSRQPSTNVLTDHVLVQKVTSWTAVCSRRHQRSLLRASPVHGRPPVLPPQISAALARLYWIASVTRELSKARRASATPAFCWPEVHQTTRIGRSGCKNWRPNDNLVKAGKLSSRTGPTHQGFAFNQVCWSRELEAIERLRQSST